MRPLSQNEIKRLENQGCSAKDWNQILIAENLNLDNIRIVRFSGPVNIHEGVSLINIHGGLGGCEIKENARIENVASLEFDQDSKNGVGTQIAVLDETGSRSIPVYPGISSQMATLMAREINWIKKNENTINSYIESCVTPKEIGERSIIKNCGTIKNVYVSNDVVINGASRLENGSVINNAAPGKSIMYVGSTVEAENFIFEDSKIESKSILINTYVGQGCMISHGFSAHDSLFFANCSMENGEAHSILAGPYTVSMHKGTLMIGCQTSFLNAGSQTNQSNHMYKLGPLHWGILERGVKTSSCSYLMLGAKIGAFSLLMGSHKTHPDSSEFPFSYLFGDDRGNTTVVPALMLRSCGLMRDEAKWPARDKRLNHELPLFDRITFSVFNPQTIETLLNAIPTIDRLLRHAAIDDQFVRYKGMKFTRAALERAKNIYTLAIFKYLSITLPDSKFPPSDGVEPSPWIDLGGQIMPRTSLEKAIESNTIPEAERIFTEAFENYKKLELLWIGRRFDTWWRERENQIETNALKFDQMVDEDRLQYLEILSREESMLSL